MTKEKREAMFEIAFDTLQKIHTDLCREKDIKSAEELFDIMRRLVFLSDRLEG